MSRVEKILAVISLVFMLGWWFERTGYMDELKEMDSLYSEKYKLQDEKILLLEKELSLTKENLEKSKKIMFEHEQENKRLMKLMSDYIQAETSLKLPKTASLEEMIYIVSISKKLNLDLQLVTAVCLVESSFIETSVSNKGAKGLMQLMPYTADHIASILKIKEYDITDPEQNIWLGSNYLKYLEKRVVKIPTLAHLSVRERVIASYYSGLNRVIRNNGIPDQPLAKNNIAKYRRLGVL